MGCEFMGLIRGVYEAKRDGFLPGGGSAALLLATDIQWATQCAACLFPCVAGKTGVRRVRKLQVLSATPGHICV
jgi:homogentisate 1,2-dioxygenase